jgi:hypothetical protein
MENTSWGDYMVEEGWLAGLPQDISLVVELDLRGIERPKLLPLSEVSPDLWEAQNPETAHIFLCASSKDARLIFQSRQIESSVSYIERVIRNPRDFQYNNTPSSNGELLMPYDPRSLHDWLSIQPGQVHKMLLPEYVAIPSKPRVNQLVVRSQMHMTRDAENRYTVVWFDFRDCYRLDAKWATTECDSSDVPGISVSTWQRRFACHFQGLVSTSIHQAVDFPGSLLLDLLISDIRAFEGFALRDRQTLPVATHAPVVRDHLHKRLYGFELTHSMIRKAEDLHQFIIHMGNSRNLELFAAESRSSFENILFRLEIESSLFLSNLRRRYELSEKRLDVYNQFAQHRQTASLSALTYCAAFFLPLSLAGTFLSMQSRARELHLIVYDFCGIAAVFCTIAAFIYFLSWAWSRVKTSRLNHRLEAGKIQLYILGKSLPPKILFGASWTLMVSSFLVGMLHNLRLGLILLAVPVALVMIPVICSLAIYLTMITLEWVREGGPRRLLRYMPRSEKNSAKEPGVA